MPSAWVMGASQWDPKSQVNSASVTEALQSVMRLKETIMELSYFSISIKRCLAFFGVEATARHLRQRGYTLQQCFDIIAVNL